MNSRRLSSARWGSRPPGPLQTASSSRSGNSRPSTEAVWSTRRGSSASRSTRASRTSCTRVGDGLLRADGRVLEQGARQLLQEEGVAVGLVDDLLERVGVRCAARRARRAARRGSRPGSAAAGRAGSRTTPASRGPGTPVGRCRPGRAGRPGCSPRAGRGTPRRGGRSSGGPRPPAADGRRRLPVRHIVSRVSKVRCLTASGLRSSSASSSRSPIIRSSRGTRGPGSMPSSVEAEGGLGLDLGGRVAVRDAAVGAHDVGQRHVGDGRAVGEAAPLQHGEALGGQRAAQLGRRCATCPCRARRRRPRPGRGRRRPRPPAPEGRRAGARGRRSVRWAASRGPPAPSVAARVPARGARPTASARPRIATGPIRSQRTYPTTCRAVASLMRMVPGSAIDCRRAATLIVSPIAVWSPSGSSPRLPTTTEPLLSPMRTSTGSRPGGVRSRSSRPRKRERREDRAPRVVLVGGRHPDQRHEAVAHEAVDRAAVEPQLLERQVRVPAEERVHRLGADPLGDRRRADDVAEEHRDRLVLALRRIRGRRLGLACERGSAVGAEALGRIGRLTALGASAAERGPAVRAEPRGGVRRLRRSRGRLRPRAAR